MEIISCCNERSAEPRVCYNKCHTLPIQIPQVMIVANTTTDVSSVWSGASGGGNWQLSKLLGRIAMKAWFSPDTPRVFAPAAFAAFLQPLGYSIFDSLRTKSTISGTRSRPRTISGTRSRPRIKDAAMSLRSNVLPACSLNSVRRRFDRHSYSLSKRGGIQKLLSATLGFVWNSLLTCPKNVKLLFQ